jgi:glucuronosyltransferase
VFISHGGLIGTQEAIFHGVPVIGIPIYADQYNNLLQINKLGFGKVLKFKDINVDNLRNMISDVLLHSSYQTNAKEVSRRFKDRPMSALDTAVFWIEYVIRNKGADFMKNPAIQLSWSAYNMLDVYGFLLIVFVTIMFVIFYGMLTLIRMIKSDKTKMSKKKRH